MSFLIDTNICSAYLKDTRKGAGTVFSRFMQYKKARSQLSNHLPVFAVFKVDGPDDD